MDVDYLKSSIKQNEILQKKDKKQNYLSDRLLQVVEQFMKTKKRICYGGTAINSVLPKEKQFYDYDIDIPDYDFFSPSALEDAKELCNLFKKENIFHVEGKNAVSFGTYKVFVNFVPIADITQISEVFYDYLLDHAVTVQDILYTPPSYLRMSLHQELARPKGDVSRWEKIYQRMQLLNTYFPILVKPLSERQHMYLKIKTKEFTSTYDSLFQYFQKKKMIFCNFHLISCVYKRYFKRNKCDKELNDFFLIYSDDLTETYKNIHKMKLPQIKIQKFTSEYKFIDDYCVLYFKEKPIGVIFQTNSCLSYIEVSFRKTKIHVGNIDTLLNLYFSLILMDLKEIKQPVALSIIGELNHLVDTYHSYLDSKTKLPRYLERFQLPCLGTQDDLPRILRTRQRKFNELKHNKTSIEYKKWFFKYTPTLKTEETTPKNKTTKKKERKYKERKTKVEKSKNKTKKVKR